MLSAASGARAMHSNVRARVFRIAWMAGFAVMIVGVASSQEPATQIFKMPRVKRMSYEGYAYPLEARRSGQQGRVVLELKISRQGRPIDAIIVESGPTPQFDDSARRLVRGLLFNVPADWEQSGGADHRYRLSVKYRLFQCVPGKLCDGKDSEPVPDGADVDGTIKITSSGRARP